VDRSLELVDDRLLVPREAGEFGLEGLAVGGFARNCNKTLA
jgi:hypothetical protein